MYAIIPSPSPILREATKTVDLPPEKLVKIIEQMRQTLVAQKEPEGVGLAANQVGLPYRLFVARFSLSAGRQAPKNPLIRAFINPEILEHSEEFLSKDKKTPLEGCLSVPKYYGVVKRWSWIKLKYQILTTNYELRTLNSHFEGFPATVVQHEMDHLNGKIFVERILEQKGKLYKVMPGKGKSAVGGEKWEEVELLI